MTRRLDITSKGHEIETGTYVLYLDVKMHIDEFDEMDIAAIDRIKVTRIFDRSKCRYIDRIYQYPFPKE